MGTSNYPKWTCSMYNCLKIHKLAMLVQHQPSKSLVCTFHLFFHFRRYHTPCAVKSDFVTLKLRTFCTAQFILDKFLPHILSLAQINLKDPKYSNLNLKLTKIVLLNGAQWKFSDWNMVTKTNNPRQYLPKICVQSCHGNFFFKFGSFGAFWIYMGQE